jgi:small subunit ribosomal protein S2
MKQLLETGVHFGHRTRKWNPKMKSYIFTERNGIHILDLTQTLKAVREATELVSDTVAGGGMLLFVGTKRQAQETIMREAERCGMPYVNQRWLGGTLTNWRTIRQRIDYLKALEARRDRGEFDMLTKKEALMLTRQIDKLTYRLGGIRDMTRLPNMLFVVDVHREHTAVREANILGIPIIAVVDTNCDPDDIDHVIPANDDAIRAIKLMAATMADAVEEGVNMRKDVELEEDEEAVDLEAITAETDEALLGEATLAKLRDGSLEFAKSKSDESDEGEDGESVSEVSEEETADSPEAEEEAPEAEEEAPEAEEEAPATEEEASETEEEAPEDEEEAPEDESAPEAAEPTDESE